MRLTPRRWSQVRAILPAIPILGFLGFFSWMLLQSGTLSMYTWQRLTPSDRIYGGIVVGILAVTIIAHVIKRLCDDDAGTSDTDNL
ncbi:MAG: hypothetical protein R3B49_08225 [Phycisphaerales bacterium]